MDILLKMLLIVFISLLAFTSGVFFGKQMSDSDHQLKALESDFVHGSTQQASKGSSGHDAHAKNAHAVNVEEAIREEEIAALSDKLVSDERSQVNAEEDPEGLGDTPVAAHGDKIVKRNVAAAHDEHDTHAARGAYVTRGAKSTNAPVAKAPTANAHPGQAKSDKPDLSAAHRAAARIAHNDVPVEAAPKSVAKESRQPNSLPRTVGASQDVEFTVQVASYPEPEQAREHATSLVKKGFPAFPVEANINGKTWYRVSVGTFKSAKDASVFRAQLIRQTQVSSAIVQKIQR